jgi:hypothetical protein
MLRIQILIIIASLAFLLLVFRMVVKGRLREEYSIIWLLFTGILVVFSFWEKGLLLVTNLVGIYLPTNLVFATSIFITLVYLLHLSVVASKLQKQNKLLAQEMAIMKNEMEKLKEEKSK